MLLPFERLELVETVNNYIKLQNKPNNEKARGDLLL